MRTYNPTVIVEPGDTPFIGPKPESAKPVGMKHPFALATASILVTDTHVLQALGPDMWLMERESGSILWHCQTANGAWFASSLIAENTVFTNEVTPQSWYDALLEHRSTTAIDLQTGQVRWRRQDLGQYSRCLTGAAQGVLPIVVYDDTDNSKGHELKMDYKSMGLDNATGETLWAHDYPRGYRGYSYIWNGQLVELPAYEEIYIRDLQTGEVLERNWYLADGGGCSFEVFTADYVVRGSNLNPLTNLKGAHSNNGVRPNCETPSVPAYGALYTQLANCNCDFYLPAGLAAAVNGRKLLSVPEADRVATCANARVAGPVAPATQTLISNDWQRGTDARPYGKAGDWKRLPDSLHKNYWSVS